MNQVVHRGPIAAFFVGLWNVMNFTRRLILNFLFFGLLFLFLVVFVAAVGRGNGVKPLLERTTLVIAPEGKLVEQFSADPATRALARA
ncbi:MAG: signal peptide peptidase SppA, partial [Pseudoxanthomonas sp.]